MNQCQQIGELLSGYVDNELTQQQRQQVTHHLERCESCRTLCDELNSMKAVITELPYPSIDQQRLQEMMADPTAKKLAGVGWIGFTAGLGGLLIWHLIELWGNSEITTLFKLLVTLLETGGVLLLASVLRQRLIARKTDRYKDIDL